MIVTTLLAGAVTPTSAQSAATVDSVTLAKYDANRNGRLDASEIATMEAEQRRTAGSAPSSGSSQTDVIQLSPFEVSSDNKGYFSPNTMSGTRLNSKLEDLGASISVVTK